VVGVVGDGKACEHKQTITGEEGRFEFSKKGRVMSFVEGRGEGMGCVFG